MNSPHLPCSFASDGCSRWFHNVSGLTKHIRAKHDDSTTDNASADDDSSPSQPSNGSDSVLQLSAPHVLSPIDLDLSPSYPDTPSTPSPHIPFTTSTSNSLPSSGSSRSWDFELHPFPVSPPQAIGSPNATSEYSHPSSSSSTSNETYGDDPGYSWDYEVNNSGNSSPLFGSLPSDDNSRHPSPLPNTAPGTPTTTKEFHPFLDGAQLNFYFIFN